MMARISWGEIVTTAVGTASRFGGLLSNKAKVATYMGVLMPNLFVAPIRYFVMRETPEVRYRMFMRDVLASVAGVAAFYISRSAGNAILKRTFMKTAPAADRDLAATFIGWVVNVVAQGVGAVRMSEWMSKKQQARSGAPAMSAPKPLPISVRPPLPRPKPLPLPVSQPFAVQRPPQFSPPAQPAFQPIFNPFAIL